MTEYSDADLAAAVAASRSWRGVLRALGLPEASTWASRTVRGRVASAALDTSHFTGQRRWSDADLAAAVQASRSWSEAAERLGLAGGSSTTTIRAHARRLGVESAHLDRLAPGSGSANLRPDHRRIHRAGSLLAAAWFELCGCPVSWPLEPRPYDLVAEADRRLRRVQVKTTRSRSGATWQVKLASQSRADSVYDPDDIDDLFVIDGDGRYYLIPFHHVAGRRHISVSAYAAFAVPAA